MSKLSNDPKKAEIAKKKIEAIKEVTESYQNLRKEIKLRRLDEDRVLYSQFDGSLKTIKEFTPDAENPKSLIDQLLDIKAEADKKYYEEQEAAQKQATLDNVEEINNDTPGRA